MKLFLVLLYASVGFVNTFGCCYMMRFVYRWKVRSFALFSLLMSLPTLLLALVPILIGRSSIGIDEYLMAAVYIPVIWLAVTDRSVRSLAASASGYIFAAFVSIIMTYPANLLISLLNGDEPGRLHSFVIMLSGSVVSLLLIVFIGRVARSSILEPMSVWNVVFIGLLAFFTSELLAMSVPDATAQMSSSEMINSAAMSLLAVAFIVISVLMNVKLTESRYYSTLNSVNESYLTAQKDYYEMKQHSDTEIRRIRHDMKNHLICIRDLAAKGKYQELESYIEEISSAVSEAASLIHTGSGIIDAIVNEKAALAKKAHVRFEWEGTVSGLNISAVDSCTLVSNLLDNALEACDKVDVDKRYILLSFRRSEHFILMTCENSAARVVELTDGRPLSTKSNKFEHGFGLENIERCVGKYGGHLDLSSFEGEDSAVFVAEAVFPID